MSDWATEAMSIYEDFKAEEFEITVRVDGSDGVFDPVTMAYAGAIPDTDYKTFAIKKAFSIRDINGTTIQTGDTKLLFASYGTDAAGTFGPLPTLTAGNKILINGVVQNVVVLNPVDPGNVAIMYEAQIRA